MAVNDGVGNEHLGVEQGALGETAMEDAAVPVGPIHHRGDGNGVGGVGQEFTFRVGFAGRDMYSNGGRLAPSKQGIS